MALRVSGKNLDIGEALRERVLARMAEASKRYADGRATGHTTVEKEAHGFRAVTSLKLPTGTTLLAEGFAPDAYAACDITVDRMEKRLKRYHHRLKDRAGNHHQAARIVGQSATYVIESPVEPADEDEVGEAGGDFQPAIIAESTAPLRVSTVAQAVSELDLTGVRVLAFRHAGHGRVNFVYRRADGHVGWIDPPAEPKT